MGARVIKIERRWCEERRMGSGKRYQGNRACRSMNSGKERWRTGPAGARIYTSCGKGDVGCKLRAAPRSSDRYETLSRINSARSCPARPARGAVPQEEGLRHHRARRLGRDVELRRRRRRAARAGRHPVHRHRHRHAQCAGHRERAVPPQRLGRRPEDRDLALQHRHGPAIDRHAAHRLARRTAATKKQISRPRMRRQRSTAITTSCRDAIAPRHARHRARRMPTAHRPTEADSPTPRLPRAKATRTRTQQESCAKVWRPSRGDEDSHGKRRRAARSTSSRADEKSIERG